MPWNFSTSNSSLIAGRCGRRHHLPILSTFNLLRSTGRKAARRFCLFRVVKDLNDLFGFEHE